MGSQAGPSGSDVASSGRRAGWGLVVVQGLLFLAVALGALLPGPSVTPLLLVGLGFVLVGAVGVVQSARDLGQALTPNPVPNGAGLAARGLYRWVRHPMYSSLVLIGLGVAISTGAVFCYVAVAALAVFFDVKTRAEERRLVVVYDGYAEYAARTGKFVPGVARLR